MAKLLIPRKTWAEPFELIRAPHLRLTPNMTPEQAQRETERAFNQLEQVYSQLRNANRDELTNYLAIERAFDELEAGGKRYATIVVAASNSLHHDDIDADYICTGANDNLIIVQALNALPDEGGRLLFMEGDYNLSGYMKPSSNSRPHVIIEGMGWGTRFHSSTSVPGSDSAACWFRDLAESCRITNLFFEDRVSGGGGVGHGFFYDSTNEGQNVIDHCFIQKTSNASSCSLIQGSGSGGIAVRNCVFDVANITDIFYVLYLGTGDNHQVLDNYFFGPISGTRLPRCMTTVNRNHVRGNYFRGFDKAIAQDNNSFAITAIDNLFEYVQYGIDGGGSNDSPRIIACNDFNDFSITGVRLSLTSGAARAKVTDNYFRPGSGATAGIDFVANLLNPVAFDNVVEEHPTTGPTHGIRIGAGVTGAWVVGNDLLGLPTPITDAGTGTVLVYPNHATYGDNRT